jgi:hypothetical protein
VNKSGKLILSKKKIYPDFRVSQNLTHVVGRAVGPDKKEDKYPYPLSNFLKDRNTPKGSSKVIFLTLNQWFL